MNKLEKTLIAALCFVSTVAIADTSLFYGSWGSEAQCSRALITPKGTKHSAPFEISSDWLQHGDVWCRLNWLNVDVKQETANGTAEALCGEDDNRSYRIRLILKDDELTLAWNWEFANSGLRRCST